MNNNTRGNNNRRRGRGNRQNNGGGQQLNRIDSRARGNAPQLLEKYRKLAQDAHLNGDRVTAEYYLQFADHYFRVLADARLRQEESRNRRDERWQEGGEAAEDSGEFAVESDFPSFEQPHNNFPRRDRDERGRRDDRGEDSPRDDRARDDRPRQSAEGDDAAPGDDAENPYEPAENPFVRPSRGLRPRRDDRRPRREASDDDAPSAGLDPASLPPAISASRGDEDEAPAAEAAAEAKPRRRAPRRKPSADDAGEALESVG